jgi:hypothetical protein
VGGIRKSRRTGEGAMVAAGPREGYGSPLRAEETAAQSSAGRTVPEPAAPAEPIEEEPWLEVLTSSLLLFRRYERGRADQEAWLEWPERVSRLRSIYDHYAAAVPDLPPFVWTRLFRDALLIPHSAPYQALTDLLNDEAPAMEAGDRRAAVGRAAKQFEVDEELLDQAAGMESVG